MNRRSGFLNGLLLVGAVVTIFAGLFRERVQAWEAGLPPAQLNLVKVLVLASAAAFLVAVIVLTLVRRRGAGNGQRPDA